jgi:hypothetical protein
LDFGNDVRPNCAGKSRSVKGAAFDFRSRPIILYSAQVLWISLRSMGSWRRLYGFFIRIYMLFVRGGCSCDVDYMVFIGCAVHSGDCSFFFWCWVHDFRHWDLWSLVRIRFWA